MDGILYLLNQTGIALANAEAELQRLRTENAQLRGEASESSEG